jgi:hypothetical protein
MIHLYLPGYLDIYIGNGLFVLKDISICFVKFWYNDDNDNNEKWYGNYDT